MANGSQTAIDRRVDVAIVGGGPAGCSAAICCAQAGHSVALLESEPFPRHRPGESLHPGVLTILRQLGVDRDVQEAGFLRYPGNTVAWGGEPHFQAFGRDDAGPWLGFQAIREKFDVILLRRAESLGVSVLQPCRAKSPLLDDGRVVGVDSSGGPVWARFILDATGGRHWLGRNLGHGVYHASRRLVAYYGYANAALADPRAYPLLEAEPTGWTWIARLEEGCYGWVKMLFPGAGGRPPTAPIREGIQLGPIRGSDVTWRLLPDSAGPGYFLLGDAASVFDPTSSHGVLRALLSGMKAAYLLDLALRQVVDETHVIDVYRIWWLALFEREVANMRNLYAQLPREWHVDVLSPQL